MKTKYILAIIVDGELSILVITNGNFLLAVERTDFLSHLKVSALLHEIFIEYFVYTR